MVTNVSYTKSAGNKKRNNTHQYLLVKPQMCTNQTINC